MAWEQRASLPAADNGKCYAVSGGKIYAIGGYTSSTAVYEYDPALDTWTARASAPVSISDHQAATRSSDGVIYVVEDGDSNEFRTFTPGTNTWGTITDSGATTTNQRYCWVAPDGSGNIYQGGGTSTAAVNRWNGSSWSNTLTTMSPGTAYEHSKAAFFSPNSKIYIHGGVVANTFTFTDQMLEYSPPTTWTTRTPSGRTRWGHVLVSAAPWVYIIGGFGSAGYDSTIFRYDPVLDTYTQWVDMPFASPWKTAAAYVSPHLYVFTGHSGSGTTALHYREEAGYDELSATLTGSAMFDLAARLEATLAGVATLTADAAVMFERTLESDSFLDAGSTVVPLSDSVFPGLATFPAGDLYPGGD